MKAGSGAEDTTRPAPGRVLVTGGAGFIGSHLADAYLAEGWEVWVADDLSSGRAENVPSEARLVEIDVGDREAVAELMREGRFRVVSHHAAQADIRVSVLDPASDARTNVLGVINVGEQAAATGVERLIFASSGGAIYGEASRPALENDPRNPKAPYGIAKLAGELYLEHFARTAALEVISLRYANVYGERQDPRGEAGVIAIFCGCLAQGRSLTIIGDGCQERDFVHVSDVVEANLLLSRGALPLERGTPPRLRNPRSHAPEPTSRAYNVGTGAATSVNGLADAIERVAGKRVTRVYAPERPGELRRSVLDAGLLRELGWSPGTRLEDGLARTWDSLR